MLIDFPSIIRALRLGLRERLFQAKHFKNMSENIQGNRLEITIYDFNCSDWSKSKSLVLRKKGWTKAEN